MNKNDQVIKSDTEDYNKLFNIEVLLLKELLTKQNLYNIELSPINSFNKSLVQFLLYTHTLTSIAWLVGMGIVSAERLQDVVQKRLVLDDCRKKKKNAIAKKQKLSGPSVEAPVVTTRVPTPRVTFISPRAPPIAMRRWRSWPPLIS